MITAEDGQTSQGTKNTIAYILRKCGAILWPLQQVETSPSWLITNIISTNIPKAAPFLYSWIRPLFMNVSFITVHRGTLGDEGAIKEINKSLYRHLA